MPLGMMAQDVTIRGNNGSCVPAVKNGGSGDTFYRCGGNATWQHEQLSMVLTTSDGTALTQNGQLDNPLFLPMALRFRLHMDNMWVNPHILVNMLPRMSVMSH